MYKKFILVLECSIEEPLKVKSVRSTFNSEGSFSCEQGWILSYIEPIYKNDPNTYCKADGRWKDEEFVHCIPGCLNKLISFINGLGAVSFFD